MMFRYSFIVTLALALPAAGQFNTKLNSATTTAFDNYWKSAEAKFDWRAHYPQLKADEVKVEPAQGDGSLSVKDGIVHDWVAAVVVPGATPQDVLNVLQNYGAYKTMYTPEVQESKILDRDGDRFRIYMKLWKKKVLSVTLNSEFDIQYRDLGGGRWNMVSRSTKISEIDEGKELPVGSGKGFLWRLNAYWLIEPRAEGLYMECRSLSLSRDVPFGLGMVVKPLVTSVPPESLRDTMDNTVKALRKVVAARAGEHPAVAQRKVDDRRN